MFFHSFKGIGIVNASPETCFKYCDPKPDGKRVKWDKAIKELEVIEYLKKDDPVSLFILERKNPVSSLAIKTEKTNKKITRLICETM